MISVSDERRYSMLTNQNIDIDTIDDLEREYLEYNEEFEELFENHKTKEN